MKMFKKILVPTDFSQLSFAAFEYANSLATQFDAQLYLLHAVSNIPSLAYHSVDITPEKLMGDAIINAKADLEQLSEMMFRGNSNISLVVRLGSSWEEIVQFAKEEDVDLIVMATHGRTGLMHILMGSVAEKVVQHSPVPVLTVKPEEVQKPAAQGRQDAKERLVPR